jgi:hypothetical protein
MKVIALRTGIIGRLVIKRVETSAIIRLEQPKVSRFILIDALGQQAEEAGLKVGDLVFPTSMGNIVLDANKSFRPTLEEKDARFAVRDFDASLFLIQNDSATSYVPFDSDDAAKPFAEILGLEPPASMVAA